jgi:hypothetical protein
VSGAHVEYYSAEWSSRRQTLAEPVATSGTDERARLRSGILYLEKL